MAALADHRPQSVGSPHLGLLGLISGLLSGPAVMGAGSGVYLWIRGDKVYSPYL